MTASDPDSGDTLTCAVASGPSHGTLSGTGPNLTYTPSLNYNGGDSFTFTATDNHNATSAPATVTLTITPVPKVSAVTTSGAGITNGNGDVNAGHVVILAVGLSEAVTVDTSGGTPGFSLNDGGAATYTSGSGTSTLSFSYAVASGQNTPDLAVTGFKLNGASIRDGAGNNADLSGAVTDPPGTLQIDTTAPTIVISTIAGDNVINAMEAKASFAISGTTVGVENGQIVTVKIVNGSNMVLDSYTIADSGNAWSANVTSAQATALADGVSTVTADVLDKAGNPAPQGIRPLIVDQDKIAETPILTIASSSLTVPAGGSVAMGINASPVDSDDAISVTISGLPSFETITAPSGDVITVKEQRSNNTYTITAVAPGQGVSGLALHSSYAGAGHPVNTLTVTATNSTSGESATSASRTIAVTDPPSSSPPG